MQDEARKLRDRLAVAQGEVTEANDALRLTKEDAAAEQAENNAALAAASAELQELRDVHADVGFPVSLDPLNQSCHSISLQLMID